MLAPSDGRNTGPALLPLDGAALQSFYQFGASSQSFLGLTVCSPLTVPLVSLGPIRLFSGDGHLVKLVERLGSIFRELLGWPLLHDLAEVIVHIADYAGFFPSLPLRRLCTSLVGFPAAFRKHPPRPACRLNEEDMSFGLVQRHNSRNKSFTGLSVTCMPEVSIRLR